MSCRKLGKPFIREWTHKDDFHVDGSTKVQVDMMRTDYYHCYEDAGNHASIIVLPYNRNTAMINFECPSTFTLICTVDGLQEYDVFI